MSRNEPRNWWRTQRTALIAVAIAAAAVVGAYVWLDVLPSIRQPDRVIEAGPEGGSRAVISGQELELGFVEWGEFDAPGGSRTLSIRLAASGGPDAASCGTATLTEQSSSRTWVSSRKGLELPAGLDETSCLAEPASYRILLVFLLPDDAEGPFVLDIEGDDSDVARFTVDP